MKLMFNNFLISAFIALLLASSSEVFSADGTVPTDNNLLNEKANHLKSMWKNVGDASEVIRDISESAKIKSIIGMPLKLDESSFKSLLSENTISRSEMIAARSLNANEHRTIVMPLPNGTEVEIRITPNSVMSEGLSQRYPDFKSWDVEGVSEKISGSLDFTSAGFHGMLLMPDGDRIFIQPDVIEASTELDDLTEVKSYLSFSEKQNQEGFISEFSCGVDSKKVPSFSSEARNNSIASRIAARAAPDLITYRLAVAATGEFTEYHGGTKESALSAIVTVINRVNQVYTRDLGVKFELVEQQEDIIYLDPDTDPYTAFSSDSMIYRMMKT